MMMQSGSRKKAWPTTSMMLRTRGGSALFTMSMRMCSLASNVHDATIRKTAPNKHPLQLEPRVRRDVEQLSDDGVDGRDDDGCEDQPGQDFADTEIDCVDDAAHAQEHTHVGLPLRAAPLLAHPLAVPIFWPVLTPDCPSLASFSRPASTEFLLSKQEPRERAQRAATARQRQDERRFPRHATPVVSNDAETAAASSRSTNSWWMLQSWARR